MLLHFSVFGHTRVDLYCPQKISTITERFLFKWMSHDSLATWSSGRPAPSMKIAVTKQNSKQNKTDRTSQILKEDTIVSYY